MIIMISCWIYWNSLCFWRPIPFGIWYNCLYWLGHSLLRFPIRYSRIIFGIIFMAFCCPWCPRVFGWVSTQPSFVYPSDVFQGSSRWASLLLSLVNHFLWLILRLQLLYSFFWILYCSVPMCSDSSSLPSSLVPPNIGWFPQFCVECVQNLLVRFWLVSGYIGLYPSFLAKFYCFTRRQILRWCFLVEVFPLPCLGLPYAFPVPCAAQVCLSGESAFLLAS